MERHSLLEWTQLRSIGNSRIVQASVLFPFIGYLILFNDQATSLLSTVRLDHALPNEGWFATVWARKLYFLYFGLMSLGFGSLGYSQYCPRIIKKYGDWPRQTALASRLQDAAPRQSANHFSDLVVKVAFQFRDP
jgi:hypothetical protein